jgi:RNA polymerase sigma-70 factor, ECF subfamily
LISDEPLGLLSSPDVSSSEGAKPQSLAEADEARIRRMVDDHYDALWRFMRRLGVPAMDLDDALQEVAVIAAGRLEQIPRARERSFLFGTAFRVASEHRRRREGRREVGDRGLDAQEDPAPEPDALTELARARALLDRVLADMSTDLRAVFTLYEIEEMTMVEIAELLGLPQGTVASRLRRAREQFVADVDRIQARMRDGLRPARGRREEKDR